jgi:hypothetical protein
MTGSLLWAVTVVFVPTKVSNKVNKYLNNFITAVFQFKGKQEN